MRESIVGRLRAAGCVFAEKEAELLIAGSDSPDDLEARVTRRQAGVPLEYVLGWASFCGLRVHVAEGVFVPRPRTELLVREAAARTRQHATVADLCCGSGAVGAALVAAVGPIRLYTTDIDPVAVASAHRNLDVLGARVLRGDLFAPLPSCLHGRVDTLVANVPYIPTAAIELLPAEARLHEPHRALDGGSDGLDVVRRLVAEAPRWLAPGGWLLVELSVDQVPLALDLVEDAGLAPEIVYDEDAGVLAARSG